MTNEKREALKDGLTVAGAAAGFVLGLVASTSAESIAVANLKKIPLAGVGKLTKLTAPIAIAGAGAAIGTLAGQGMTKKCEKTADHAKWLVDLFTGGKKKDTEVKEETKDVEEVIVEVMNNKLNESKEVIVEVMNNKLNESKEKMMEMADMKDLGINVDEDEDQ